MKKYYGLAGFILPGVFIYSLFFVLPCLAGLGLSFTDWNGVTPEFNFTGLANYTKLVTADTIFHTAFANNIRYMLFAVVFQTLFSLGFSLFLIRNTRLNVFYRVLFFLPTVIASVSIAFIWTFVYDPSLGMLNIVLDKLGLSFLIQSWLGDRSIAIYSLAVIQVWAHTGQVMVIFIAGLQGIPESLKEVARIEGAGWWQRFRHVTWPLLAPAATIVVAYTTLQTFKAFDLVLATTNGGPSYATEILSMFLYHQAFNNFKFGYASASAVLYLLIVASITLVQFRLLNANKVRQ
jgi:raffinose/stachyose/melibiose transport system permease protein